MDGAGTLCASLRRSGVRGLVAGLVAIDVGSNRRAATPVERERAQERSAWTPRLGYMTEKADAHLDPADLIAVLERLVEFGATTCRGLTGRDRLSFPEHLQIALVLFPRTLDTALGVARLARAGLGAQGIMLTRPLFEDMVDLHWASARADVAAERFRRYMRFSWLARAEHARPLTPQEGNELAQLRKEFGKWGSKGWTNCNVKQRVDDIAEMWPGEADILREHHRLVLKHSNEVLHGSPLHLNDSVTLDDLGNARIPIGPRPALVVDAVDDAHWLLLRSTRQFVTDVAPNRREALDALVGRDGPVLMRFRVAP